MTTRIVLLMTLLIFSTNGFTESTPKQDWFQFNQHQQTYTIDSTHVRPSVLLRELAITSGIEILYDDRLTKPIQLYTNDVDINRIVSQLERDYSTITQYRSNQQGNNVLAKLTILPKGQLTSEHLTQAILPIEEAINLRSGDMPESAKPIFLTRLDYLENEIRAELLEKAEKIVAKREKRNQKRKERKKNKEQEIDKERAEIEALKQQDPELYQRKKSIFEAVHGKPDSQ